MQFFTSTQTNSNFCAHSTFGIFSGFPGNCFLELPSSFQEELITVHRDVPPTSAPSLFFPSRSISFLLPSLPPSPLSLSLRILEEAALVTNDTVVCGFHKENMEWCLCVWRGWGCHELEVFYQSCEELGRLETGMRKRRQLLCRDSEMQNHSSVWRASRGEYTLTDCQCSEQGAAER